MSARIKAVTLAMLAAGIGQAVADDADIQSMMEVIVVSASGAEQFVAEAPASITVITREELLREHITSLADALRGVQGININALDARDGKTGNQSISLRGLPRDYTLVLIDGVRQNPAATVAPNSFADSQSVFMPPIAAIERIEIIRGPMSTLYGADALGGVVNIITRKPTQQWTGSVSLSHTFQNHSEYGGKSLLEAYTSGALGDERLTGQFFTRLYERSASHLEIPGTTPSLTDNRTMGQNPVAADAQTFGSRFQFDANPQHQLSLAYYYNRQSYNNELGQMGRIRRDADGRLRDGYDTELGFKRDQWVAEYRALLDFGVWHTQYAYDAMETTGRTIAENAGYPDRIGSARGLKLNTQLLNSRLMIPVGDHNLTLGGQFLDPRFKDDLIGSTINSHRYSLYAQDEWQLAPSLALTYGVRYEKDQDIGSNTTPRAYLVWNLSDALILKGGYSQGYRIPMLEQKYDGVIGFGDGGSTPLFGNPNLKPETSDSFELSALYDNGQNFAWQATLFRTELSDLIERGTGANSGVDLNIGEARLQGLELATQFKLTPQLSLNANYSWIDSELTKSQLDTGSPAQSIASKVGDPFYTVPKQMLNLTLNYQLNEQWNLFASSETRSSSFRPRNFHEPMTGGSSQGAVAIGVRDSNEVLGDFKGYTLLNLGTSYQFTPQVTLTAMLYNALDKNFIDYQSYDICANGGCTELASGMSNRFNSIQERSRLHVSLRVDF